MSGSVAVVGGSLAGLRAAEQLRIAGHAGPITVYGAEPHAPYNRPPLSKEMLAHPEQIDAATMAELLAFRRRSVVDDVEFRHGVAVDSVDLAAQTLTWRDRHGGEGQDTFAALVAASGLRPRRLAVPGPPAGRHVLRTIDDAVALRIALPDPGDGGDPGVVVIGAGFVGTETACTLRKTGHRVTVVEPTGAPMNRILGDALAQGVQRHHEAAGINFVIGRGVTAYVGTERVEGVLLDDGTAIPATLVIEAVGSVCNTEFLAGNGLDLTDGVLTDNSLAVHGAELVVAVGDIARFPNPLFDDEPRRVEHWSMPTESAKRAAQTLAAALGGRAAPEEPFAPIPSFWSDQSDLRLQSFGSPGLGEPRVIEGDLDDLLAGVLVTYHRGDAHVGTVALNLSGARQRELRAAFLDRAT
jgi:3-phenylpropionate/trans-cinnamate dioxygenase ferredoxin reductase component